MMKKNLLMGMCLLCMASVSFGALTYLPESDYVSGTAYYNTGDGYVYVDYAVYDTSTQTLEGYDGDEQYVYAYQIINSSTTDIDAISILGFDVSAVTEDSLDTSDELDGTTTEGEDATTWLDTDDVTILYVFEDGAIVEDGTSLYLLIYSDYDYVTGSFEINPSDTSIATPGDDSGSSDSDDTSVPEPATLALLLGGGLLTVARKK